MMQELLKANEFIEKNANTVKQEFRNKYHLMAPIGWINDPNGFVYYQGEYHLFYQHYPYDSVWGPMHWGHAKSKDLVHWEHLPVALAPSEDYDKDGCFSGSAIEKDGKLYLLYTGHSVTDGKVRQVQCLAVSEDGIHFEKIAENPVIDERQLQEVATTEDFRDPKIFQRGQTYYTVVATKTADARGQILMFRSPNLVDWQFNSVLLEGNSEQGTVWECPDLFELDGNDVLIISPIQMKAQATAYQNTNSTVAFIGAMDWQAGKFQVENFHEIDSGLDFYAPQTCENADGARIMVAWMQMWQRKIPTNDLGHGWSGSMTLPRRLSVSENYLVQQPIPAIYEYLQEENRLNNIRTVDGAFSLSDAITEQHYLKLVIDLEQAQKIDIQYAKGPEYTLVIRFDREKELLTISREQMSFDLSGIEEEVLTERSIQLFGKEETLTLEIFRDTSAIEVFINAGLTMSTTFYQLEEGRDFVLQTDKDVTLSLVSGAITI